MMESSWMTPSFTNTLLSVIFRRTNGTGVRKLTCCAFRPLLKKANCINTAPWRRRSGIWSDTKYSLAPYYSRAARHSSTVEDCHSSMMILVSHRYVDVIYLVEGCCKSVVRSWCSSISTYLATIPVSGEIEPPKASEPLTISESHDLQIERR